MFLAVGLGFLAGVGLLAESGGAVCAAQSFLGQDETSRFVMSFVDFPHRELIPTIEQQEQQQHAQSQKSQQQHQRQTQHSNDGPGNGQGDIRHRWKAN